MKTDVKVKEYEDFQQLIENRLEHIRLDRQPKELYEPVVYMLSFGGKRIRPVLLLMAFHLFEEQVEQALSPALAMEVFHNFTLMHDDIMDKASLRRGKATVHETWSSSTAILSGDVMLIMANELLSQVPDDLFKPVMHLFNQTAIQVCEGQQWDMIFETKDDVSIADYMKMIGLKTASLLAASLRMGGLLARASVEDRHHLSQLGTHLGLAFQLRDDYLDVFGAPEKFGKKPGGDIVANKKTYMLLQAMELAGNAEKKELGSWLATDKENSEKVRGVTEIYRKLGLPELVEQEVERHYSEALRNLDAISVPDEKKQPLRKLGMRLMERSQ
ncbi:MAG: polyprenyl synthetase family protein [Bacteroidia bacterium]